MWLGYGFAGNVGFFKSPYEDTAASSQHKEGKIRISGVMWFTNLDHPKRHQMLPLDLGFVYKDHEDMYPKYDNYEAINIDKTAEIPCDYNGVMGVPITFLDKYCPEQFEIVGFRKGTDGKDLVFTREREREYNRIFESSFEKYCKGNQLNEEELRLVKYFELHKQNIINNVCIEPVDLVHPSYMAIIGCMNSPKDTAIKGEKKYARILIKRKESNNNVNANS